MAIAIFFAPAISGDSNEDLKLQKGEFKEQLVDSEDPNARYVTHKYCAPVFIMEPIIFRSEVLTPENYTDSGNVNEYVRNATLTFIEFRGEVIALTCNHLLESLMERRKRHLLKNPELLNSSRRQMELYTIAENGAFVHFNYEFSKVPSQLGRQPDVAISRIKPNCEYLRLTGSEPLPFVDIEEGVGFALASGYPEEQRATCDTSENTFDLTTSFVSFFGSLQLGHDSLVLAGEITEITMLNNLSGMSGGPVVWTSDRKIGLAGIITEGKDIKPKVNSFNPDSDSLYLRGERITSSTLDNWLNNTPPIQERENLSFIFR